MTCLPAFMDSTPYTNAPHIRIIALCGARARYLELTVTNASSGRAHHPFPSARLLLSAQGIRAGAPVDTHRLHLALPGVQGYHRYTADYTFRFRVRLDYRELADGVTLGGALGRWMFHCHIFFHGHHGMMSELVVTALTGEEKPNVNVGGSWAYARHRRQPLRGKAPSFTVTGFT